ncbi:hypothetical protein Lser_V15G12882 [Lactuca serriola]
MWFHSNSCSSRRRSIFHRISNCDDALDMFHEITHRQPLPPVARFNELLQAVTKKKHYSCSVEIFQRMNSVGAPIDSLTISIVTKCLCQMHHTEEGFAVLGYGYKCGVVPDVFTFSALLHGLILEDKVPEAYAFFKKLIKNKVCDPNGVMYTNMIKGLCKLRLHDEAIFLLNLYKLMGKRDYDTSLMAYSTIIHRLCKDNMVDEALKLFRELIRKNIKPRVTTFSCMLHSLRSLSHYEDLASLFIELDEIGFLDLEIRNLYVRVCCKIGHLQDAEGILQWITYPHVETYNSLIEGYSLVGEVTKAKRYLDLLRSTGEIVDVDTYNTLLKGHFKDSLYAEEAIRLLHKMSEHGVEPNVSTYNTVLEGLFKVGCCSLGVKLFNEMLAHSDYHLPPNIITYMIVLEGLCDKNKVDKALSLFHLMGDNRLNSEIPVYNILIDGASKSGKLDTARTLFKELIIKGLKPDDRTYTVMINGFCLQGVGVLEEANQLFLEMKEKGFLPKTRSYNLLIQGFLTNEQRDIAETLIQEMKERGLKLDEDTKSLLHAQDGYWFRLLDQFKPGTKEWMSGRMLCI